jgi:hypothetical protein
MVYVYSGTMQTLQAQSEYLWPIRMRTVGSELELLCCQKYLHLVGA